MINRRYLRMKVLQALYAHFQDEDRNIKSSEKELINSVDAVFDLYVYQLSFLISLHQFVLDRIETRKQKRLATEEDLNPNLTFVNNSILISLSNNEELLDYLDSNNQLSWKNDKEFVAKIWAKIEEDKSYKKYINAGVNDQKSDKLIMLRLFEELIAPENTIHELIEEKNLHWYSSMPVANNMIIKTIKNISENEHTLIEVYKKEEDRDFMINLFNYTLSYDTQLTQLVDENTKNWNMDRLAFIDLLMLKMALCEFLYFPNLPARVTINEYIEIAKEYSTPKSKNFINGILDSTFVKLTNDNLINKNEVK